MFESRVDDRTVRNPTLLLVEFDQLNLGSGMTIAYSRQFVVHPGRGV